MKTVPVSVLSSFYFKGGKMSKEEARKIIYSYSPVVGRMTLDGYANDDIDEIIADAEKEAERYKVPVERAMRNILDKCFGVGSFVSSMVLR